VKRRTRTAPHKDQIYSLAAVSERLSLHVYLTSDSVTVDVDDDVLQLLL